MTPFELERALTGRMAARACRNLMGRYCFYRTAMRGEDIMAMWSKAPDARCEMPWGVYDGWDSVRRRYVEEQPAHGDLEARRGSLVINALSTCAFEVAGDTRTARGIWMCQGVHTEVKDGKADCRWIWTKYGVDFIFEDGQWRIWHLAIYPLIDTPYEKRWYDNPKLTVESFRGVHPDRKPTARSLWSMHVDNPYPLGHPAIPRPYDNFDHEVGYGY